MAFLICADAQSQEQVEDSQVWLVSYGPGETYWESFGHNGIWIRDPRLGLDHVFNFGFFDFEQESFFWRFLQGRMLYFSAAQPAQQEFSFYIDQNRTIRAQRLALTPLEALNLTDYLVNEVQAQNRDYLYDYYWNNCSTRVRDALDTALGGRIRQASLALDAMQNMRDNTRRLTISNYWVYLALELTLGSPVDQAINRWDEFFIPAQLADGVAQLSESAARDGHPLVVEDLMLYTSSRPAPAEKAGHWWPRYLLLAGIVLALGVLMVRLIPWFQVLPLVRSWLLLSGSLGLVLLYLWLCTDHDVARNNLNLAIFNPLWLLACIGRRFFQTTAWLLIGLGLTAMFISLLGHYQYMTDVMAAFLPLNLMAAILLLRSSKA